MKIFGHPVHLMLVHFPSALFPLEFALLLAGSYTQNPHLPYAAFYVLGAGVSAGWLAMLTGITDMARVRPADPGVVMKAVIHGAVNTTVLLFYSTWFWTALLYYPQHEIPGMAELFIRGGLVVLLSGGNYLGASLVLKDGIGTESIRKSGKA